MLCDEIERFCDLARRYGVKPDAMGLKWDKGSVIIPCTIATMTAGRGINHFSQENRVIWDCQKHPGAEITGRLPLTQEI